jgi:fatty acid-binding protein DegV
MHVEAKIRGNRETVLRRLVKYPLDNIDRIDPRRIVITHCESPDDAVKVKTQLAEVKNIRQVVITNASCVIASHCGPRTIGIIYLEK